MVSGTPLVEPLGPVYWGLGTCSTTYHRCSVDWDVGNSEACLTPWALCSIPLPEQVLWCVRAPLPAGGQQPLGSAVAMTGCTWSAMAFGLVVCVKESEHCIVTRCSLLFTSPVSGINVVADQCI